MTISVIIGVVVGGIILWVLKAIMGTIYDFLKHTDFFKGFDDEEKKVSK